jgi:hypothetical protein
MAKIIFLLFLILFSPPVISFAQCTEPQIGVPIEEGKVTTEFLSAEGIKAVCLDNLFIYTKNGAPGKPMKEWLNLMLWGQKVTTAKFPFYLMLGFAARSEPGCRFPNSLKYQMTFVADGNKMKIGSIFSFNEPESGGACTASLMVKMPYDILVKIAKAKKTQLIIADLKLQFTERHLKALNKFVNEIS